MTTSNEFWHQREFSYSIKYHPVYNTLIRRLWPIGSIQDELSWIWDNQKGWKTDLQAEWWGTGSPADKSNPTMKIPSPTPRALLTPRTLGVRWITLGLTLKDPFAIQHELGIWCTVEISLPWQLYCFFRDIPKSTLAMIFSTFDLYSILQG